MLALGRSNKRSNRKGISPLLSGILFTAIIVSATMIVFSVLIPKFTQLQESVAVDQGQLALNHINDYIKTIVDEGETSQRVIPLSFKEGQIVIRSANSTQNGRISYEIETETNVISPRTKKTVGNLVYSSNAYATLTQNSTHLTLTNSRMTVYINRSGNSSDPVDIDLSSILENIYLEDYSKSLFTGTDNLNFEITDLPDPSSGYVYAKEVGSNLGRAEAVADLGDIEIHFILESSADYLRILVTSSNLTNPPSTVALNLTSSDYVSSDLYKGSRYIYTNSGGYLTGLVNYNSITESSVSGNTLSASIPFVDNKIYLPFTRSTKENMDFP